MRVLVIEDDSETAAYIAKGLREAGQQVETVRDGREGLLRATL
jgi:two-component system, OmpR family, response regulator